MPEPRLLRVFLCHAKEDKPIVRELYQRLKVGGWIEPWLDERKLLPGQDWRTNIEEAVESADVVVICLSNYSVNKEGFVQKELRYAREIALEKPDDTIFLIPLKLEECEVPRGLRFYQWTNYFGEQKEQSYTDLLDSLKLRYEQIIRREAEELANKNAEAKVHRERDELSHKDTEERIKREVNEKTRVEAEELAQKQALETVSLGREELVRQGADKRVSNESSDIRSRHKTPASIFKFNVWVGLVIGALLFLLVICGLAFNYLTKLYPVGGGLSDSTLKTDVWNSIIQVEREQKNCSNVVSTAIDVTQQPDSNGIWKENWTVDACGSTIVFNITFTPKPTGGTNYAITSP